MRSPRGSTCIASKRVSSRSRAASWWCADPRSPRPWRRGPSRFRSHPDMRLKLDVVVWRGAIPKSVHRIQAVAADPDGRIVLETERPDLVTTFRSAAKPFPLLPLVERGHAQRWKLTDEELAVMCASHTGSAYHLKLVSGVLERLG